MNVKLLTEIHLEFPSLEGGCIGSSESTLVKMPHCWKSHVTAHFIWLGSGRQILMKTSLEHVPQVDCETVTKYGAIFSQLLVDIWLSLCIYSHSTLLFKALRSPGPSGDLRTSVSALGFNTPS